MTLIFSGKLDHVPIFIMFKPIRFVPYSIQHILFGPSKINLWEGAVFNAKIRFNRKRGRFFLIFESWKIPGNICNDFGDQKLVLGIITSPIKFCESSSTKSIQRTDFKSKKKYHWFLIGISIKTDFYMLNLQKF